MASVLSFLTFELRKNPSEYSFRLMNLQQISEQSLTATASVCDDSKCAKCVPRKATATVLSGSSSRTCMSMQSHVCRRLTAPSVLVRRGCLRRYSQRPTPKPKSEGNPQTFASFLEQEPLDPRPPWVLSTANFLRKALIPSMFVHVHHSHCNFNVNLLQ